MRSLLTVPKKALSRSFSRADARIFSVSATIQMSYVYVCVSNDLAESQKPPGLLSIGADEGVRIHILSGRACKTYVKLM